MRHRCCGLRTLHQVHTRGTRDRFVVVQEGGSSRGGRGGGEGLRADVSGGLHLQATFDELHRGQGRSL